MDKTMFGWDHKVSATPDELKTIVESSSRIHKALGSFRIRSREEQIRKDEFRRSIVSSRKLKAGDKLNKNDILLKRPGTGISPNETRYVIGRVLKRDIEADELIRWEDFV
jgi:N-acetylneuraminate synthase